MAQFDSLIIFSLIWSILLILIAYYKLSIEVLIPHMSGVKKFSEKKIILLDDFQKANSAFLSKTSVISFFNNLVTFSSFLILPPNGFGKFNMFSWFYNHSEDLLFIKILIFTYVFMLLISIFGFYFIYCVYKKDNFFVNKVIPYFKTLSFTRKILFGSFTLFKAIPNKFWINVKIHVAFVFLISILLYFLGFIFPLLFFFYFMYLVFCFESILFGLMYKYSVHFRSKTNLLLFGGSHEPFAEEYFHWFWGNMFFNQGAKKGAPFIAALTAIELQRKRENQQKIAYADDQTDLAVKTSEVKFKTPQEVSEFHVAKQREWVMENGTVTKVLQVCSDINPFS